jgi:hypothetical protein
MSVHTEPRCRCGVYESAHLAGRTSCNYRKGGRLHLWRMDHLLHRHIAGWLWLSLPSKWRWRIIEWFQRPGVCWCDLVNAAHGPDHFRSDYKRPYGCLCEVPLPTDARPPRPGECYCDPRDHEVAS